MPCAVMNASFGTLLFHPLQCNLQQICCGEQQAELLRLALVTSYRGFAYHVP